MRWLRNRGALILLLALALAAPAAVWADCCCSSHASTMAKPAPSKKGCCARSAAESPQPPAVKRDCACDTFADGATAVPAISVSANVCHADGKSSPLVFEAPALTPAPTASTVGQPRDGPPSIAFRTCPCDPVRGPPTLAS